MGAWTEQHAAGSGSLIIDVEALDAEETERAEIASFKKALTAPRNDPEEFIDRDGVRRSTLEVVRVLVGLASAFALALLLVWSIPLSPSLATMVVGFLAGMILPQVGLSYLYGKRRARYARSRSKFTITVDAEGFVVEREGKGIARKIELDAIECFEGQRRIALIDKNGKRTLLPLSLATPALNEALADRLNAATTEARASRGGYRGGGGPRIAASELDLSAEEPTDEAPMRERR